MTSGYEAGLEGREDDGGRRAGQHEVAADAPGQAERRYSWPAEFQRFGSSPTWRRTQQVTPASSSTKFATVRSGRESNHSIGKSDRLQPS